MGSPNTTISNFTVPSSNMAAAFINLSSTYILVALIAVITFGIHKLKLFLGYQNEQSMLKAGPSLPPGPKTLPVIGSLHLMLANKPVFQWIHKFMEKNNTGIACFRLGKVHVVTVTSHEIAQELLLRQDSNFTSRPVHMSTELPTYGYLTVALTPFGQQWKKMRRIVTSEILSAQRHRWLQDKRAGEADNLMLHVHSLCKGGGIVNMREVTQHYCGNVIRKLMINKRNFGEGTANGGPGLEEIEHVNSLFTILGFINAFSVSDYLPWLRRFDLDGHEGILQSALKNIRKYNDPVIDGRIETRKKVLKKKDDEPEDILDILINLSDDSGAPLLTPQEIKAQILDLMLAAVDNPSNATEWALAEMLNEPKTLKKALEEIDEVVGRDRLVQESDFPKLNYIKACAREAFRMHPVSAFNVPHVSNADTKIAGYFIPKGSHILVSRITLGRNPKIWAEPDKFMPERHMNADGSEVVLTDPKLGLISFSTGRRGCPGVLLGSTMTTMLLARLLHGFNWSAPPNVSSNSLLESNDGLTFARPLVVLGKPRLSTNVYRRTTTPPSKK